MNFKYTGLRPAVLTASVSILVLIAVAGPVRAGDCSLVGGTIYVCSGPADAGGGDTPVDITSSSSLTVTTDPGFGIDTSAGIDNAITLLIDALGTGDLIFVDENGAFISGGEDAIFAWNNGTGALSITTTGTVTGGLNGIHAINSGTGGLTVEATGSVSGLGITSAGIKADNGASSLGDLTVSAVDATGGNTGIFAVNRGAGAANIRATGTVSGGSIGIQAVNMSSGTALTISAADVTGGNFGIIANNSGTGALKITTTGTVTGQNLDGLYAENTAGSDLMISVANVSGGVDGIEAVNFGAGSATRIWITGTVMGETAYGINLSDPALDGTSVVNDGTIIGGGGTSIYFSGTTDFALTLLANNNIQGLIDLGTGTNTLNVTEGLSLVYTFAEAFDLNDVNAYGSAKAVSGTQVAVAGSSTLGAQDAFLAHLTGGIFGAVQNRLSGVRSTTVTTSAYGTSAGQDKPARSAWVQGFGAYRHDNGDDMTLDTSQWLGGGAGGADGLLRDDLRVGFFAGGAYGRIEAQADAQTTDSTTAFAGAYAELTRNGLIIDLALTAGYSEYDQDRRVLNNMVAGGFETATADFGGWFISPELTVTKPVELMGQPLEASVGLRYAGLFIDGYTETGSSAPVTVDDGMVNIGVARLQLAAPKTQRLENGATLLTRIKGGIEGRTDFGGDSFDGFLLGQPVSFDSGDGNAIGGFAGLSGEYATPGGLILQAGVEGLIETGGSYQFSGQVGTKFEF
ncbi:autotransporter outer membrane beta-barrel domain-containing protein [Nitratireductor sp. XY-223]|uniref:autotransporter outer membrane beta-barrel domain-containing protein n=1 Tax=Nitratireductor sp. XY-223 TaxID=2561926 RepID=UPI0010A9EBE1|nr:autotransporter outer membrane beta-barrel domain-containing protein [Nitratireductor sp. XY-223]